MAKSHWAVQSFCTGRTRFCPPHTRGLPNPISQLGREMRSPPLKMAFARAEKRLKKPCNWIPCLPAHTWLWGRPMISNEIIHKAKGSFATSSNSTPTNTACGGTSYVQWLRVVAYTAVLEQATESPRRLATWFRVGHRLGAARTADTSRLRFWSRSLGNGGNLEQFPRSPAAPRDRVCACRSCSRPLNRKTV